MSLQKYLWEGWFSLTLPDDWSFSEENGVISIFNEDTGVGALQVSFARRKVQQKPTEKEARQLALDFASQRGWKLSEDAIQLLEISDSPASVFNFHDDEDSSSWQIWHIVNDERVAFITYVCDPADFSVEEQTRRQMVETFRWEDT